MNSILNVQEPVQEKLKTLNKNLKFLLEVHFMNLILNKLSKKTLKNMKSIWKKEQILLYMLLSQKVWSIFIRIIKIDTKVSFKVNTKQLKGKELMSSIGKKLSLRMEAPKSMILKLKMVFLISLIKVKMICSKQPKDTRIKVVWYLIIPQQSKNSKKYHLDIHLKKSIILNRDVSGVKLRVKIIKV